MYNRLFHTLTRTFLLAACALVGVNAGAAVPQSSALATGRWVKIKVKESGMHQITFDQLRQWGFDNPEKVGVYGFPAVQLSGYKLTADRLNDLPAVACSRTADKIVFYGSGDVELEAFRGTLPTGYGSGTYTNVKRNYYADFGTYFLTDSRPTATPATVAYQGPAYNAGTAAPEVVSTTKGMSLYEKEVQNTKRLGARYWDEMFADGETRRFDLSMPGFKPEGGRVNMLLYAGHCAQKSGAQPVTLASGTTSSALYLNAQKSNEMWLYGTTVMLYDNSESSPLAKTDNDIYPISLKKALSGDFTIDYISALYPTETALSGRSQAIFTVSDISSSTLLQATGNTGTTFQIWDVTNPVNIRRFETEELTGTSSVWFSSPGTFASNDTRNTQFARFVVFEPDSELLPVEYAGEVSNQNLHGMPVPEMLIITASEFVDQANRLAGIHRAYNGLDVAVVTQDEVYNEFSSGTPMIMALRSFAGSLYERDASRFRSILLLGAAHWDNRYLNDNADDCRRKCIPMFLAEHGELTGSYPRSFKTDAFIAMLDYNTVYPDFINTRMNVGVGRIPAPTAGDVSTYIDKVEKYLTNMPSAEIYNNALVISDSGDHNGHMLDADELASDITRIAPGATAFKASNATYPFVNGAAENVTDKITDTLNKGISFMSFSGHALSSFAVGDGKIWTVADTEASDYPVPPAVMLATCNGIEPSQSTRTLGEVMLSKTNGGAIAVVAACRSVYMDKNQYFAREIVEKLFTPRADATMGTMIMESHNGLIIDSTSESFRKSAMLNRHSYALYGDPEIPVMQASHRISITAVNGSEIPADGSVEVAGGTKVRFAGAVVGTGGAVDTGFNGDCSINIFDSPITLPVINYSAESDKEGTSTLDEMLLVSNTAKVVDGRFSAEFYVPEPRENSTNRMQFYAESNGKIVRDGWKRLTVTISGSPSVNDNEQTVPVIADMYINSPDFSNGDIIDGASATLYAHVEPNDNGIIGQSAQPGKSVTVTLDNSKPIPYATNHFNVDSNGAGTLEFPLPTMADGKHTLTFTVANAAGQTASESISFTVVTLPLEAQLTVEEYPARQTATINLEGEGLAAAEGRLVIKDAQNHAIHTVVNPTFPYVWNLQGSDNRPVEGGLYTVEAYLKSGMTYGSAKPAQIVVHY